MMKKTLFALSVLTVLAVAASAAPLKIGWATRDITGEVGDMIPGQSHRRISQGTLDPLSLTVLVIDNGEDSIVFLSADITSWNPRLQSAVRKEFEKAKDINFDKIIFSSTHTHTSGNLWASPLPDPKKDAWKYIKFLSNQCVEAVREAWEKRAPGGVAWGIGFATIGWNRRAVYFDDVSTRPEANYNSQLIDGHARMYGKTNDPKFSGLEGGGDPHIQFLYTFDPQSKLTGAVINVACPSQCSEMLRKYSADFWGNARQLIRAKHGNIPILAQCSAAGDLSPHLRYLKPAIERRYRLKYGRPAAYQGEWRRADIAAEIDHSFEEVLSWAKKDIRTDLPIANRRIKLDLPQFVPAEEELAAARRFMEKHPEPPKGSGDKGTPEERRKADALRFHYNRVKEVLARTEALKKNPNRTISCRINVARLGEIAFASNPYELYLDYAQRIQARSPFEQTFIVQLSLGGEGGYLPTERSHANRGYGSSYYSCPVDPAGGQQLVETTLENLNSMAAPQPRPAKK